MGIRGIRRQLRALVAPTSLGIMRRRAARLDWPGVQRLGARLGRWGRPLARHRVFFARDNLRLVFGDELDARQRNTLALRAFESAGRLGVEMLKLPTMSPEELAAVARFDGLEVLAAARTAGRGAIAVSAHLGNWEVGAVRLIYEGYQVVALSRASQSARIARAVTGVRKELDFATIPVDDGIRPCLRLLQDNGILAIMPDRRARGHGVNVQFFGYPVNVWHTPVLLALRSGAPVIPLHALRQSDGTFVVRIEEPIPLVDTGDRDHDVQTGTQQLFDRLEARIREHPEQYLWQYDLWLEAMLDDERFPRWRWEDHPELSRS